MLKSRMREIFKSGAVRGVEALLYGKNIVTLPNRKRGATGNTKYAYAKGPYYVYSTRVSRGGKNYFYLWF